MHSHILGNIGSKIGRVLEVDEGDDGRCPGRYARIRINLNLALPLQQGICVQTELSQEQFCIILVYEKLPNFCFKCGRVGHVSRECDHEGAEIEFQFGNWLRASNVIGERKTYLSKSNYATTSELPTEKSIVTNCSNAKMDELGLQKTPTKNDSDRVLNAQDDNTHSTVVSQSQVKPLSVLIPSSSVIEISDEEGNIFIPDPKIIPITQKKKWKPLAREIPKMILEKFKISYVEDIGKHELDIHEERCIRIKCVKYSKLAGEVVLQNQAEGSLAKSNELPDLECTRAWEPTCNP